MHGDILSNRKLYYIDKQRTITRSHKRKTSRWPFRRSKRDSCFKAPSRPRAPHLICRALRSVNCTFDCRACSLACEHCTRGRSAVAPFHRSRCMLGSTFIITLPLCARLVWICPERCQTLRRSGGNPETASCVCTELERSSLRLESPSFVTHAAS